MFCGNCGQQLKDDAKFCHGCGSPVGAPDVSVQPDRNGGDTNVRRRVRRKKNNVIWIPIVAAVLVLGVLIAVLAGSLLGSDSAKLMKAVVKSGKAYTTAAEEMGVPDLSYIAEKKAYSGEVAFWIDELEGSSEMQGMGARMDMDVSLDKREIGMSVTPFFGSADIMNAQLKIDNEKVYIGAAELTGDTFYMINTETLGRDLNNLGANVEELDAFGFNLFDIVEQVEKISEGNEEAFKAIEKDFLAFAETIEVEKMDSEKIEVNGNDLKCTVYHVVISEDALRDLLDVIEEAYAGIDNTEAYLDIFRSMGLPEEALDELEYELAMSAADPGEMFYSMREALNMLGDVELDVYVNDGYVVAAVYEKTIQGSRLEIVLNLGGGENYADDISLLMNVDGNEVRMTSTGNHTGDGGKYTDETVVEVLEDGYGYTVLSMEMSYEPKAKEDNFEWQLNSDGISMDMRGQVTADGDSMHVYLDEVSVSEYGYDLMTIGVEYRIGKYESSDIETRNAVALGELTEEELMDEVAKIEENAMGWAEDLMNQFPELMYYLY